jgi:hypothetical protein
VVQLLGYLPLGALLFGARRAQRRQAAGARVLARCCAGALSFAPR